MGIKDTLKGFLKMSGHYSDSAVYLAEPIADVLAVTFTSVLFFFRFRKALQKMDEVPGGRKEVQAQ